MARRKLLLCDTVSLHTQNFYRVVLFCSNKDIMRFTRFQEEHGGKPKQPEVADRWLYSGTNSAVSKHISAGVLYVYPKRQRTKCMKRLRVKT